MRLTIKGGLQSRAANNRVNTVLNTGKWYSDKIRSDSVVCWKAPIGWHRIRSMINLQCEAVVILDQEYWLLERINNTICCGISIPGQPFFSKNWKRFCSKEIRISRECSSRLKNVVQWNDKAKL